MFRASGCGLISFVKSSGSWLLGWFVLSVAACGSDPAPDAQEEAISPKSSPASQPNPALPSAVPGAAPTASPATDAATSPVTASSCFADLQGPVPMPQYDQFGPTLHPSCAGTRHQDIQNVEKLVFLGDSVTAGTPPTSPLQFYRARITEAVIRKFGAIEVASCAKFGANLKDLLHGEGQISKCFPNAVEPKRTLVVMTMGGNDVSTWATKRYSAAAALSDADVQAAYLREAMTWFKNATRFPKGADVVFGSPYEYTDTSGDLMSCPTASLSGLEGNFAEGAPAIRRLQEQMMKVAVDTRTDMVFLFEHFCGHGYKRNDPNLQCYRGPNAENWFDITCIHPTPEGHKQIAERMKLVIGL